MSTRRIANRFYNETAAIEQIQLLASFAERGKIPDDLYDFLIECTRDDFNIMFPYFNDDDDMWAYFTSSIEANGDFAHETLCEWFFENGIYGYMVKFATPVMDDGTYSWGFYRTQWVYGDTVDEAFERGFKWVASQREAEAKKSEVE